MTTMKAKVTNSDPLLAEFLERWVPIEGFEGYYEISDFGNVRSVDRTIDRANHKVSRKGKPMKLCFNTNGYLHVGLRRERKKFTYLIHGLVWDHFASHPRNGRVLVIDHVNDIRTDNRIDNLQLISHRANINKNGAGNFNYGITAGRGKFSAQVQVHGERTRRTFATEREAKDFYIRHIPEDDLKVFKPASRIVAVDGQEVTGWGYKDDFIQIEVWGKEDHTPIYQVSMYRPIYKFNIGDTINIEPILKPKREDFSKGPISKLSTWHIEYNQALTRWETYKWKIA